MAKISKILSIEFFMRNELEFLIRAEDIQSISSSIPLVQAARVESKRIGERICLELDLYRDRDSLPRLLGQPTDGLVLVVV